MPTPKLRCALDAAAAMRKWIQGAVEPMVLSTELAGKELAPKPAMALIGDVVTW